RPEANGLIAALEAGEFLLLNDLASAQHALVDGAQSGRRLGVKEVLIAGANDPLARQVHHVQNLLIDEEVAALVILQIDAGTDIVHDRGEPRLALRQGAFRVTPPRLALE